MKNSKYKKASKPEDEIKTDLLDVIPGNGPNEYFVLANWTEEPCEPETIHCCIVSVQSTTDQFLWKPVYNIDTWVHCLTRLSPDSILLGTADGNLIRITQGNIEIMKVDIEGGVNDIWVINEQDCWLAHNKGLSHWNGQKITKQKLITKNNLIQEVSPDFAVAYSNALTAGDVELALRLSKQFPKQGSMRSIHTIHGLSPDFAVAVGDEGLVLLFDGEKWKKVKSPTQKTLTSVFCVKPNQIFIGGWKGTLYKWNGKDHWQKIKFSSEVHSSEIYIYDLVEYLGDVYVCTGDNGLYKIQEKRIEKTQDFYASRAAVIANKFIITAKSFLTEFNGIDWGQAEIRLP